MNDAIGHTGKDNLKDNEGPCSCHSKDPCCPENGQFTTDGKKERDVMEGELILIRLHTKKIHIVLSMENMSNNK